MIRVEVSYSDVMNALSYAEEWITGKLAEAGIPVRGVIKRAVDLTQGTLTCYNDDARACRVFIWEPK